jgi:superfamily II DNA/RNA helicase
MLIVAPTRELAMQSQEVLEEAGKSCNIRREDRVYIKRPNVFAFSINTGYTGIFCE